MGEDGPPPGFGGGAGFEYGVDPNLDPELALVMLIINPMTRIHCQL